jgi:hypothetical protein
MKFYPRNYRNGLLFRIILTPIRIMKKRIFALIVVTLTFTNTSFAQFPSTSSDLWFEIIGREYSSVSGTAATFKGLEGKFYTNGNGVFYQLVKVINKNNYQTIALKIAGFMFKSPEVANKYNIDYPDADFGVYSQPLPLELTWGMTEEDIKKGLPRIVFGETNENGEKVGIITNLPGFNNLGVSLSLKNNILSSLYIGWQGASSVGKSFWHPKGLYSYNLKGAMQDLKATKEMLEVGKMYTFLDAYFNRKDNQIPGLAGFNTDYEEKDGAIRMILTYCTNDLNFKYSFYNRLQNKLNLLLSNNIVKPSSSNYAIFEAYDAAVVHDDFDTKKGETFYYHKEDADHFKTKNKWPIFHLYTLNGTNEVVFEVIPSNVDSSGNASSLNHISGDGWLRYFFKDHKSKEVLTLLNYLTEEEGARHDRLYNDEATTYKVYKLGIALGLYPESYSKKNKIKKMENIWFYSEYNTDNAGSFPGKLPLGFSFDQSYEELKKQASIIDNYSQNTLKIIKHGIIECTIRFDDEGRIKFFLFGPKIYNEQLFDQTLESLGIDYLEIPEPGATKNDINRFETKFQKVCTSDYQSTASERDQYIISLNLDFSIILNPAVADLEGAEIISAIGRPTVGTLGRRLIEKLGAYTDDFMLEFYGTMNFENAKLTFNADKIYKDLRIISNIYLKENQLKYAPLGIKQNMKRNEVRKLFPANEWADIKEAELVRNYKGYRFSFGYTKNKLSSISISFP